VKLRELSVTYNLPETVARQFHATRASITLTGRNLHTWTDYTGVDPEVNGQGQSSQSQGFNRNDFFVRDFVTQPPVRLLARARQPGLLRGANCHEDSKAYRSRPGGRSVDSAGGVQRPRQGR